MQSVLRWVQTNRWALLCIMLASTLSACATPIVYNRPAADCSTLVPPVLRSDVAGAVLPADRSVGSWVVFGDAQTGQLEKANADKRASIEIVEACEKRDRAAAGRITKKPWWVVF